MKKRGSTNNSTTSNPNCPCCGRSKLVFVRPGTVSCDYCREGYKRERARRKSLS